MYLEKFVDIFLANNELINKQPYMASEILDATIFKYHNKHNCNALVLSILPIAIWCFYMYISLLIHVEDLHSW